jgi:hypothetical protein
MYAIRTLDKWSSIFIRDKPILSSEWMLHKDYGCKGSVEKIICGHEPQGAWRQDEPIGGKPSVVKWLWLCQTALKGCRFQQYYFNTSLCFIWAIFLHIIAYRVRVSKGMMMSQFRTAYNKTTGVIASVKSLWGEGWKSMCRELYESPCHLNMQCVAHV